MLRGRLLDCDRQIEEAVAAADQQIALVVASQQEVNALANKVFGPRLSVTPISTTGAASITTAARNSLHHCCS